MAKIVPAILASNPEEYQQKIRLVRQLTDRYQLDVIDSEYADNPTLDLRQIEPRRDMLCDVHLMSRRPLHYLNDILALKPHMVIFQYEGAEDLVSALEKVKARGVLVGLALNPATEVDEVGSLLPQIDHVLIMAYTAGFAGQTLQPKVLKKADTTRQLAPTLEVGLDGGVSEDTLAKIAKAKFDVVNTNSYLFGSDDVLSRYSELMEALA